MAARSSGAETRTRIMDIALSKFVVDGYRGTSVRDLADDVGVTQPTLYYHFGSKDGILAAIVEPLLEDGEELLQHLGSVRKPAEACRRLALEGYYDLIVDHLPVFLFVETDRSVRSSPVAGHRLADQASRFLELVAGSSTRARRIRAAAALGAIRRCLRLPDIEPEGDRALVLRCAHAAFKAAA